MKIRFEHQAKKKGLKLHVIPCRAIIHSDEVLMERIVQNLLSNAIRYTTTGKVLLGCRRRRSNLCIEVWDTGPGIPEEQRSMIFQDHYQLDNPARDRHRVGQPAGGAAPGRGATGLRGSEPGDGSGLDSRGVTRRASRPAHDSPPGGRPAVSRAETPRGRAYRTTGGV